MIDVIYPVHNRLFYTQITFPRVLHECISTESTLWIYDDNSTDGSTEFIKELIERSGYKNVNYHKGVWGNSTFCINNTLEKGEKEFMYKIDNDCVIPKGAFKFMADNIPETCGFLMMRESGDYPLIKSRSINYRTHIGGIGLFRRSAFDQGLIKSSKKYFGFTSYQTKSKWLKCEIDAANTILDLSPWYSREKEYSKKGWGRIMCNTSTIWN